ncbi:MAG: agmatine deiminase family protein [Chthoniobacterales bacterium]|nr:agmatine deiminase family protein [Chthoniobacterales bacterium]
MERPAELGFRMPAEWEPHEAVWFSWPHPGGISFPGAYERIPGAMAALVRAAAEFEPVRINVMDADEEAEVRRHVGRCDAVEYFHVPTNEPWCRDHGPVFLVNDRTGEVAVVDFDFNAWGGKYEGTDHDRKVPSRLAERLGMRCFTNPMVLEGGSIEVNGTGSLLTTRSCLLNPNRNPHLSQAQIGENLRGWLGAGNILWLDDGIEGDDTDGHIDDLTRFVAQSRVVTVVEDDPQDPNHAILRENVAALQTLHDEDGQPLEIVSLPMPARRLEYEGQRLPASYANFLVVNGGVLMPAFDDPRDAEAAAVLATLFPGRKVVPVDCRDLIIGLGSVHCLSQQQPAPPQS